MPAQQLSPNAQLALDTVYQRPTTGVPTGLVHLMEHAHIERLAGVAPGAYKKSPREVYLKCILAIGVCGLDQFIPDNPLSMGDHGYEGASKGATTGAEQVICDGMAIDSPEAVVEHMEKFVFPSIRRGISEFNEDKRVRDIIEGERKIQEEFGPDILKTGYGFVSFPGFAYGSYGYVNYFSAYALYPEVMEKHYSLQADWCVLNNRAAARAYSEAKLPPMYRLDHDMADSRGTLVTPESLDRIWLPHFARCIEPVVKAGVRLLWHCDGNLMAMVPRLIEAGVSGFQGFQYEDGMDYERICRMRARDGSEMLIMAGASVTRTLPMGTADDVRREVKWLVEKGPRTGLFLACSSSVTPGVPWDNIAALVEGLNYYRTRGRR